MIVVADTGPINYLVLSSHIELLRDLYGSLIVPSAVHRELLHHRAPASVRSWVNALPAWVSIGTPRDAARFAELGPGEREAISLALEHKADFLLIEKTLGRQTAVQHGVAVKGTLGVLEEAATLRLVDLREAVTRLKATGIFLDDEIVLAALERDRARREQPHKQNRDPDRDR